MKLLRVSDIHTLPNGNYSGDIGYNYNFSDNAKETIVRELFGLGLHLEREYNTVAEVIKEVQEFKLKRLKQEERSLPSEETKTHSSFSKEEPNPVIEDLLVKEEIDKPEVSVENVDEVKTQDLNGDENKQSASPNKKKRA